MTDILIENVTIGVNGYSPYISNGTDGFTHNHWIVWNGVAWVDSGYTSTNLVTFASDPANIADGTYYLKSY